MNDSYSVASGYVNEDSSVTCSDYSPTKDSVLVQILFETADQSTTMVTETGNEVSEPMIDNPLLDPRLLKEENRRLKNQLELLQNELELHRSQSEHLYRCLQRQNDQLDSEETGSHGPTLFTCSSYPNTIPQPPKSLPILDLTSDSLKNAGTAPSVDSNSEEGCSIATTGGVRRYQTAVKNTIMSKPMHDHSSSSASANDSTSEEEPERDPMIHASSLGLKHRSSLQKNHYHRKRTLDRTKTKTSSGVLPRIDSIADLLESGELNPGNISTSVNINGHDNVTKTELKPTSSLLLERATPKLLLGSLPRRVPPFNYSGNESIKSPHKKQHKQFNTTKKNAIGTTTTTTSFNNGYHAATDIVSTLTKRDLWKSVQDRATWLIGLLILQSLSSFIISRNEQLLQQHIVIVQFLTMLVGAGGNAGNQASVNVIRGLAVGTITDSNIKQSIVQEIQVAFALSLLVGISGWFRAAVFMIPIRETIAITASLYTIVFISVVFGAILPLIMRACHVDPAHSSTTIQVIMDILGVLITVSKCYVMLNGNT